MLRKPDEFDYLHQLPLEEYQKELGLLLSAAISIACEERPDYEELLIRQKREIENERTPAQAVH